MTPFPFDLLRRFPDVEAENLYAFDASDRYLLDETRVVRSSLGDAGLVIIGDRYGALTLASIHEGARGIRVHQDGLSGELALRQNAERVFAGDSSSAESALSQLRQLPLGRELLGGAETVLLQLPRSLEALDEIAQNIARFAPDATVYAGGRIKHLTLAMNEVLGRYFESVVPSLARQKSRLLIAQGSRGVPQVSTYPRVVHNPELGIDICAHGAAFGGTKLDPGTRLLLSVIDGAGRASGQRIIDLGCGTGVIATVMAMRRPEASVIATDQSAAAVLSARETAQRAGVEGRVNVLRDDGLSSQPDASADLIVLNPPFHVGATVHAGIAYKLFDHAARVLRPGGELWVVYNSHLGYRHGLERLIGPTRQVARDRQFTVTASVRGVS